VKAIKMIGLAALVALMAMAFTGATSAMATTTQLCGHDGSPCEAVRHVHENSTGPGASEKAVLLTSIGNTECNALYLGDTTAASGEPLILKGTFTYSNCTLGGSSCTAKEENGPAEIKVKETAAETTEVTGEGLVHVVCSGFIDCSYTGTGLKGTGKGPLTSTQANGEVTLTEQSTAKEAGGFLCPKTAKLDITTTPLSKTYVRPPGELGYCVETEHKVGIYTDNTCSTVGKNAEGNTQHEWTYALVFAPKGFVAKEKLCYGTLLPFGLWQEKVSNTTCAKDDLNKPPASLYEVGTIVTVE
jgi:hypothetical protein